MRAPSFIGLLVWTSLLLVPGLAATTLRLEIVDGQGAPVVELALRVEDADGQPYDIQTNAEGQAVAGPLTGPVSYIRTATLADGHALQVEPTTPTEGLRLGLIPDHERTVRLIADGGLLFLDPEELFPADDPAPAAPDGASARAAAAVGPVIAVAPSRVLIVGLVAVVASTIVVLIGSFVVRRQA